MSKECDGSIGWGTIFSLSLNAVLSIVTAGVAWKSYKAKATAKHEVEAHNTVTYPDGRVETRDVRASIVATKETEHMSFEIRGKATAGNNVAAIDVDAKDIEVGPKGGHLQARNISLALNSAMSAVDDPTESGRKDALVRLAVVTHNPTHTATASAMQAAAKVVSGRTSRAGSEIESLDDGSGVALVSASTKDGAHRGKLADVTLLAMAQQRSLVVVRGNSGGDGAEHAAVSAGDSGDTVIQVLGDAEHASGEGK